MKTLAVLMVILLAACDGEIGEQTDGLGGAPLGTGGAISGTGGAGAANGYSPDPAPDCPLDSVAAVACDQGRTDRSGNECMDCTGEIPASGCAIRANSAHNAFSSDLFCVGVGRCRSDCAFLWP